MDSVSAASIRYRVAIRPIQEVEPSRYMIHHLSERTNKPTLLLAHGFSDNGLCWSRVAREMEVEFDLIMVDARNHGQSGRGICSSDDLADDLAAVISGLSAAPTFART